MPWLRTLITAIVIVGIAIAAYAYLGNPGPRERDRIVHPAGYSIVKPNGWIAKFVIQPDNGNTRDAIMLGPENWKGLAPSMWVKRLSVTPDSQSLLDAHFVEGSFMG